MNDVFCDICESFSFQLTRSGRQVCPDCLNIESSALHCDHNKMIRCPRCRHLINPYREEMHHAFNDGDHDIICPECQHQFKVAVSVEYTFTSPRMDE